MHGNDRAFLGQALLSKYGQRARINPSGSAHRVRLAQAALLTSFQATRDGLPRVVARRQRNKCRRLRGAGTHAEVQRRPRSAGASTSWTTADGADTLARMLQLID